MTTIVDSNLPVARPSWDHSRLESRIVHLGCGAFHRAHQALLTSSRSHPTSLRGAATHRYWRATATASPP